MTDSARTVLNCSCEDTIPLDGEAVRRGCPGAQVTTARQLCRSELAGKHWMYQAADPRLEAFRMCGDCRVIAAAEASFDGSRAPPRPELRTAEHYLRERAQRQKGEA